MSSQTEVAHPRYSWEEPKNAQSTEVLDELPPASVFAAAADRVHGLVARIQTHAGAAHPAPTAAQVNELATCHESLGNFAAAEALLLGAISRAEESRDLEKRLGYIVRRARLQCRQGSPEAARESLELELANAERHHAVEHISELLCALANIHLTEGDVGAAWAKLDRSFECARAARSVAAKAHSLSAVGVAYIMDGQLREAEPHLLRASLLYQRAGDRASLGLIYNNLGVVFYQEGRFVDAIPYLELGLSFDALRPDLLRMISCLNNNVRAHELHYMDRAGPWREQLERYVAHLGDSAIGRLTDRSLVACGRPETSRNATFASDPVIAEVVLCLVIEAGAHHPVVR